MRSVKVALATALILACGSAGYAQAQNSAVPAQNRYYQSYYRLGYVSRAALVCQNTAFFHILDTTSAPPDIRKFGLAYPKTVQGWVEDGVKSL
jgi:hypothetical protein